MGILSVKGKIQTRETVRTLNNAGTKRPMRIDKEEIISSPKTSSTAALYFSHRKTLLIAMGLGLTTRLAMLFFYLSTHNWQGETWEYEEIARNLLNGRGYIATYHNTVYRSFVVPVFPLLSYVLHLIGGPGLGLYYVFHLSIAMGVIGLAYMIAARWFGRQIANLAALLVALEPGLIIYHSYKVEPGALSTFFLLLGIYLFIAAADLSRGRLAVASGLSIGLGILTRPDLVAGLGMLIVGGILLRRRSHAFFRLALPFLAAVAIVLSPWVIRNYSIHGKVLITSSIASEFMWRGNNPHSTGTTVTLSNEGQFEAAPEEFRRTIDTSSEMEILALFQEEAIRFIVQEPAGFLWRSVEKFWYFWWFSPTYAENYYGWFPAQLANLYKLLYGILLGLVVLGGWSVAGAGTGLARRASFYLLVVVLGVALIHSATYVEGRHRVLIMPILLIWAAQGIIFFRPYFRPYLNFPRLRERTVKVPSPRPQARQGIATHL